MLNFRICEIYLNLLLTDGKFFFIIDNTECIPAADNAPQGHSVRTSTGGMNLKKTISHRLAAAAAAAAVAFTYAASLPSFYDTDLSVYAADTAAAAPDGSGDYRYFYSQLTEDAVPFYNAMYKMYKNGTMKTGKEDYDLIANGDLTQQYIADFGGGNSKLLQNFGAARDAFYMDYPDIFYVDFSALSVRITEDKDGYHAYLGAGRRDNYYTPGFTSVKDVDAAIAELDKAADALAAKAKEQQGDQLRSKEAAEIEYVHDAITNSVSYRLEDACKEENINLIRTSYGALVKGESVCEGYSRAFKTVLDRLDIPCVLINGAYVHADNSPELHMWCSVELDDEWYGVDVTMDDPINPNYSLNGKDGFENHDYLLAGSSVMNVHHYPSGIMSEAEFEFEYPMMGAADYGSGKVTENSSLSVEYRSDLKLDDITGGGFIISYDGMGCAAAAKKGYYMLMKNATVTSEDGYQETDWYYITPEFAGAVEDSETQLILPMAHVEYAEFGITTIPPGDFTKFDFFFHGDPLMLTADSGMLHNLNGVYKAPPSVVSCSPKNGGNLYITGKTYHVTARYSERLIKTGSEEPTLPFSAYTQLFENTAKENSYVGNFSWDGDRTIEFDFRPSNMYMDDDAHYTFTLNGLAGVDSAKAPNDITFSCGFPPAAR